MTQLSCPLEMLQLILYLFMGRKNVEKLKFEIGKDKEHR